MCVAVKKFQQMMLSFFRNGSAHQLQSIPTLHKNFFTASPVSFFLAFSFSGKLHASRSPPIPLREVLRELCASAFRFGKRQRMQPLKPLRTWSGTLHGRPGARCSSYEEETASSIHDSRSTIPSSLGPLATLVSWR